MDYLNAANHVFGRVRTFPVAEHFVNDHVSHACNFKALGPAVHNDVLYDWAAILIGNLRNEPDGKSYHIGGMLIEFDNSGGAITPPTVNRDEGLSYYNNLNTNYPTRDYLRVPLIASEAENTDETKFTAPNMGRFYAHSLGTTGVHGLTFSDAANSVVYGGGLVAYRDYADASQDLVFSRFYFTAPQQVPKAASSQIGFAWEITGQ